MGAGCRATIPVCMTQTAYSAALAIAFEGDAAPEWVILFPAGGTIPARDGRTFRMDEADARSAIAFFEGDGKELYVDIEHASQVRANEGLDAPAVGWIAELSLREGALWGRIDWTARGRELISTRAYRYISPTFFHDDDGRILALQGAGLTNNPAFRLPAMASRQATSPETSMNPDILKALGLAEDADQAAVDAATLALAEKQVETEAELATAKAAKKPVTPDPGLYVPRADFEAATARVKALEDGATAQRGADEEAAVDEAVEAGKITPAGRELHLASCRAMGAAAFRKAMDGQPVIAMATRQVGVGATAAEGKTMTLDADELAMARQFGRSPEAFAKLKAGEAAE